MVERSKRADGARAGDEEMQRRDAAGRVSGRTGGGGAAKINASRPASQTHPRTHADQHAHAHEFDQINIAPGECPSVRPPPPKKGGSGGRLSPNCRSVGDENS